jgi:hypothetical protein
LSEGVFEAFMGVSLGNNTALLTPPNKQTNKQTNRGDYFCYRVCVEKQKTGKYSRQINLHPVKWIRGRI